MPPGRQPHHGRARTALAILLAALPVIPLPLAAATGPWQHVGPPGQQTNTTSTVTVFTTTFRGATNYGAVGGRVTTLAIDPTNAKGLYAGTAGGGVWKSTDDGATWATTTDAQL